VSRPVLLSRACPPRSSFRHPEPGWTHEIKHDGFRIVAHRDRDRVRLWTRTGNDFSTRFAAISRAIRNLKEVTSCIIDGEAIVENDDGLSVFKMRHGNGEDVLLCAFDLLELNGKDLRKAPIEDRKQALRRLLKAATGAIVFNEPIDGDGPTIYRQACKLGCEGIVSKRLESPYQSGRSVHWFKIKNPQSPAVRREAEIEWRR
jgi:bifunctional non-homologous end joining protein LigD